MNHKEVFYFVTKCLTISFEAQNKLDIEKKLQQELIDWDKVVQLSIAHYVFPALCCNLERANFFSHLPKDLVPYMQEITTLNRQRNKAIIKQEKKLNTLLIENGCTPIFFKGTGNLLAGLYEDIAERMVGDIDFIFSEKDYRKAIKVSYSNGY